jgi:hypothetical protein
MKNLAIVAMLPSLFAAVALPVFAADPPKTAEECKKTFAGDQAKIKACMGGFKLHRTVILSTDEDDAKVKACLDQPTTKVVSRFLTLGTIEF